uniref:Galactosyltransferase N-terminal domain-containing protein n=1 Tax=Ciona savignyi TaxID=51511 RepID=H2YMA4_CIOSA
FKIAVSALLVICFLYIFALYSIQVHIHKDKRSLCSAVSPLLTGSTGVNFEDGGERANWPPTLKEIDKEHQHLKLGGYYPGPRSCVPRSTVAVILPYRDRDIHLRFQLHYLHGILYRQQTRYVIIVAEQIGSDIFNKGQLMNTAFNYVVNDLDLKVDCVFFHDVDSISEDDRTLYECKDDRHVVHLSHRMDKFNYRFCCGVTIGGVLGMSPAQFHSVNGFSNVYSGWGGEDDDMDARIKQIGK